MEAANAQLFEAFRASGRIPDSAVDAARLAFTNHDQDPAALAEALNSLGFLTKYQFKKIQGARPGELLFGDYLILNKIGEGGMGKVYQAVHNRLRILVALKVVRPQLLSNKTVMKRYEREARAAQQLDHPNIVKLIESGDATGKYYLAMEFVDGSDLARLVKENGPLPYPEACEYIRQAALGLQHAHDLKFVHRDIKPSNLLVHGTRATVGAAWNANVKILDMGLVRSMDDEFDGHTELTRDGTVVGTPDYMAPEQAKNSSNVDSRTDLYALGCTLYYLIRGQAPFPKGTSIDKLIAHQIDPVPDLRSGRNDIPPMLGDIVARLMRKKPEERYQTAAELAAALAPFTPDALSFDLSSGGSTNHLHGGAGFSFEPVELAPPGGLAGETPPDTTAPKVAAGVAIPVQPASRTLLPAMGTPEPTRRGIATPVASPPSLQSTASPSVRKAKAKAIPKPLQEPASSDSLPGTSSRDRSTARFRAANRRKKSSGMPVIALAVGLAVTLVVVVTAVIIATRSGNRSDNSQQPPTTNPSPPPEKPGPSAVRRQLEEFLPDNSAGFLVFRGKPYFDVADSLDTKQQTKSIDLLKAMSVRYRYDPRKIDRGVVAFMPTPTRFVASADGPGITPEWAQAFDNRDKLFTTTKNPNGALDIRYWLGTFQDSNRGVFFPKPHGYSLSHEPEHLANILTRATGDRRPPSGVSKYLLEDAAKIDQPDQPTPPFHFAASGNFEIPHKANGKDETLASQGIELLTVSATFGTKIQVQMSIIGRSQERLRDFVNLNLPKYFESWHPEIKPLAMAFHNEEPGLEPHPLGFKLTCNAAWEWKDYFTALEALLPSALSAKKLFKN